MICVSYLLKSTFDTLLLNLISIFENDLNTSEQGVHDEIKQHKHNYNTHVLIQHRREQGLQITNKHFSTLDYGLKRKYVKVHVITHLLFEIENVVITCCETVHSFYQKFLRLKKPE